MKITDKAFIALKRLNGDLENKPPTDPNNMDREEITKASQKLEGQFVSMMIKAMEKTIPKESGSKNDLASMMFSQVMGDEIARQGGMGLSDFLIRALQQNGSEAIKKMPDGFHLDAVYKYGALGADEE